MFVFSLVSLFYDPYLLILYIYIDSSRDNQPSKKQELWKTSSLDRNPQLNQTHAVKRYVRRLCACAYVCMQTHFACFGTGVAAPCSSQFLNSYQMHGF